MCSDGCDHQWIEAEPPYLGLCQLCGMKARPIEQPGSMWRFVQPAPIEAAHVLAIFDDPPTLTTWTNHSIDGQQPDRFTWHLLWAIHRAPEPTLLKLASLFPGYASAVACAKDGDFNKLRQVAGDYVKA